MVNLICILCIVIFYKGSGPLTKGDKYLIIFIIIASIGSLIYIKNAASAYDKKHIKIQVDGEDYKIIYFDPKIVGKKLTIETEFGYNLLEIGDGKVRVIDADCPDQLDVKQGYISKPGEVIVCLPNRLVIEIIGEMEDNDVDYISR